MIRTVLLLLALWPLTVAAAVAGWRLGARSKRVATGLAMLTAALLAAGAWASRHLSWLPEWMISPLAVYLHSSWFAPFGAFLFLLAARQAQEREAAAAARGTTTKGAGSARRLFRMLCLLTGVVLAAASYPLVGPPDMERCETDLGQVRVDADNVVRQSTNYTCGAAACATLLRRMNIDPAATETEMVPLCLTRRWGGATTLGMAVGLKRKAAAQGWHVRIVEPDWEALGRLRMPVVCAMGYAPVAHHAVVVCAVEAGRVKVADPLGGLAWWTEQEFRQRFQNEAVIVFRNDPFEAGR